MKKWLQKDMPFGANPSIRYTFQPDLFEMLGAQSTKTMKKCLFCGIDAHACFLYDVAMPIFFTQDAIL